MPPENSPGRASFLHSGIKGYAMLKYVAIALVAATAALADPSPKKEIDEALKREQRIQDLSAPPRSASNICRGC
jgi:hypothetical protein